MAIGIIRKHSKLFIWVILFFIIVVFALFGTIGMIQEGCMRRQMEAFATLNGEDVERSDFNEFSQRWNVFSAIQGQPIIRYIRQYNIMYFDPEEVRKYREASRDRASGLPPIEPKQSNWGKEAYDDFWGYIYDQLSHKPLKKDGVDETPSEQKTRRDRALWALYILRDEAKARGITLSDREIIDNFPNKKMFDLMAMQLSPREQFEAKQTNAPSPVARKSLLKTMREFGAINRLMREVGQAYHVSGTDVVNEFHKQSDGIAFKYISYSGKDFFSKIKADLESPEKKKDLEILLKDFLKRKSEEERLAFEKSKKESRKVPEKFEFREQPSVRIEYCMVPYFFDKIRDSIPEKDYKVADADVKKHFEDNREKYFDLAEDKPKNTASFSGDSSEIPVPTPLKKKRFLSFDEAKDRVRKELEDAKKDKIVVEEKARIRNIAKQQVIRAKIDAINIRREGFNGSLADFAEKIINSGTDKNSRQYRAIFKAKEEIPRHLTEIQLNSPRYWTGAMAFDITPQMGKAELPAPWGKCQAFEGGETIGGVIFPGMLSSWRISTNDGKDAANSIETLSGVFDSEYGAFFFVIKSWKDVGELKRTPEIDAKLKRLLIEEMADENAKKRADFALSALLKAKKNIVSEMEKIAKEDKVAVVDSFGTAAQKNWFSLEKPGQFRVILEKCREDLTAKGELYPKVIEDSQQYMKTYRVVFVTDEKPSSATDLTAEKRKTIVLQLAASGRREFLKEWIEGLGKSVGLKIYSNDSSFDENEEQQ